MAYNKLGMVFVVFHSQFMGVLDWQNRDDEFHTCEYYEFDPWSELSRLSKTGIVCHYSVENGNTEYGIISVVTGYAHIMYLCNV